jgi:hypothetical protein
MKNLLSNLFKKDTKPNDRLGYKKQEQKKFSADFKKQLIELKDKGLSIPIVTL